MNKLMIAATLALTMGAQVQASNCSLTPPPPGSCALVYNLAVNVKTTAAKGKVVKAGWSDCELGDDGYVCWRVKANRSFRGFVTYCGCDCGFQDGAVATLWEQKTKSVLFFDEDMPFNTFWRIGNAEAKKSTAMEVNWVIADFGQGMGYGTWNVGKDRMQKANGAFIGWLPSPEFESKKSDICCTASVLICDDDGWAWEDVDATVAWGTWNLSYNQNASISFDKNGTLPFPNWFWK